MQWKKTKLLIMTIPSLFREYLWLVKTIRRAGRISLKEINEKWLEEYYSDGVEIARTTFMRHRNAIEEMFGISIKCDCKNGYAYYIDNDHVFNDESVQNWMLSTLSVNNIILDSLSLQDHIFLESIPADSCLEVIVDAMKKGVKVNIGYQKYAESEISERLVEPYFIKLHKRRWYLMANTESGNRLFSFDRIVDAELTKEKFRIPQDFDAKSYSEDCYGVMRDERFPAQRIVLRAFNREKFYMEDLPVHPSQRKIADGEGYTDYEVYVRPTSDFIGYILSRGAWLKVMEPVSVAEMVRENIEMMTKLYKC